MKTSKMSDFPFVVKILMLMALVVAGSIKGKFIDPKQEKQSSTKQGVLTPVSASFQQTSTKSL